jgi:hypothetical protein
MSLLSLIERLELTDTSARAFVGFDGYVDRIQRVVQYRTSTGYTYFDRIGQVADLIQTLAGRSGQLEIVTLATKIGGNAPILANALATLGVTACCTGPLDDPIFGQLHPACARISLGNPATTHALEFSDGKVMLSEVSPFDQLTWAFVAERVGMSVLQQHYQRSHLLAFVDWANLPHANDLWSGYLEHIVRKSPGSSDRFFLFDLCDPTKRSTNEIVTCLSIVADYAPYGRLTLGMNENEARRIYLALEGYSPDDTIRLTQVPDMETVGRFIQTKTSIPTILIHPTDCSLVATADGVERQIGRLVPQPKVLTGAGDNLNAGYCWGLLHGFDPSDCLLVSMAASGAYIQNGYSPTMADLIAYIRQWHNELS